MRQFILYMALAVSLSVGAETAEDYCVDSVLMESLWFQQRPLRKPPQDYLRTSSTDPRFFARAEVDFTGALQLFLVTKIVENGQVLRSELRADEEFARILKYYAGSFNRLRLTYVSPEGDETVPMADMILEVNDRTAGGESLREAVWESFFARQARRHGYDELFIDTADGTDGHYEMVIFELRQ